MESCTAVVLLICSASSRLAALNASMGCVSACRVRRIASRVVPFAPFEVIASATAMLVGEMKTLASGRCDSNWRRHRSRTGRRAVPVDLWLVASQP